MMGREGAVAPPWVETRRPLTKMLGRPVAPLAAAAPVSRMTPEESARATRLTTESARDAGTGDVEPLKEPVALLPVTVSVQVAERLPVEAVS